MITDLKMPEMDGVEVIRRLRKISPGVRIIACTGTSYGDSMQIEAAEKYGAKLTLLKPLTSEQLLAAVAKVMSDS